MQPIGTTIARSRVIMARDLAQMTEGLSWVVWPDVYCTGLYKGELLTVMVSKLMEWDKEEGIVNRAFMTEVLTMELINLLKRPRGTKKQYMILEDLQQEDVDDIRRSIKADAFKRTLPEEYKKLRDYLGVVGLTWGMS